MTTPANTHAHRDKREFHTAIIGFVTDQLLPHYLGKHCTEEPHYKNIESLIEFANQKNLGGVLGEDGYRYGGAQKITKPHA